MSQFWREAVIYTLRNFLERIFHLIPNILAMITIIILGILLGWVVKFILYRILRAIKFDRLGDRWGFSFVLAKGGIKGTPSSFVSLLFYWVIVFIFLLVGINALQLNAITNLVIQILNYLPNILAALLILIAGYLISVFFGHAALIAAVNTQLKFASAVGKAVRWLILVLTLAMALSQLGIAKDIVLAAFTILFGGIVLALALALGWGGKEIAREFLEKQIKKEEREEEKKDKISHL